jgi:hypothetical protein
MFLLRTRQYFFVLIGLSLLLFTNACDSKTTVSNPKPIVHTNSTPTTKPSPTPTQVVTQPVPPTQTDCPANGTARAMVTAPLAQGVDPQIVYAPVDDPAHDDGFMASSHIDRYDTVTHKNVDILDFSSPREVKNIFLGLNRQWVFIISEDIKSIPQVSPPPNGDLQAVRIDGQGFQTLYCNLKAPAQSLSPDGHWLVFDSFSVQYPGSPDDIKVLDTTTGNVQSTVTIPEQNTPPYNDPVPFLWISNTQIYLSDNNRSTLTNTYLLDVTQVKNQTLSALPLVTDQKYISAATNGSDLYLDQQWCQNQSISYCTSTNPFVKSTMLQMPAKGGAAQTVYENPDFAIDQVYLIGSHSLLFLGNNSSSPTSLEFWTINTDGSNVRKLTSVMLTQPLNVLTVAYVSLDETQFLVQGLQMNTNTDAQTYIVSLQDGSLSPLPDTLYGSISGGWTNF